MRSSTRSARAIDDALMGVPSDPFLWLVLFWLGKYPPTAFSPEHLEVCKCPIPWDPMKDGSPSKAQSPGHGALFPSAVAHLAESATAEFVGLVALAAFESGCRHRGRTCWPIRRRCWRGSGSWATRDRRLFAKCYDRDLDDVPIPGVDPRPVRQWH